MQYIIRIALIDDHQIFLEGLVSMLKKEPNFDIVLFHHNPLFFLDEISYHQPDIVMTDISMPNLNGIELISKIKTILPEAKVLVMSSFKTFLSKKLVHGFLSKDCNSEVLIKSIIKIYNNEKVFDENITFQDDQINFEKAVLSKKEIEIVKLIAQEKTTEEIANLLFVSKNTIETHRKNIFFKLHVSNMAGLIQKAVYLGYI